MKRIEDFWGAGDVLFLDLVASYIGVSVCKNSLSLIFIV